MRTIFILLLFACHVSAQKCEDYFYFQPKKVVEMSVTNKKGNYQGKQVYTIKEVTSNGGAIKSMVDSEFLDKNNKSSSKTEVYYLCDGKNISMDMKIFMPQEQEKQFKNATATAEKVYLEYPSNMKSGDILKDGSIVINMDNNGLQQVLQIDIFDRSVEGAEKITNSAGSWDTFKINQKMKIAIETMGIPIKFNLETTDWFSPGFGTVKSSSKYGISEVTSIK